MMSDPFTVSVALMLKEHVTGLSLDWNQSGSGSHGVWTCIVYRQYKRAGNCCFIHSSGETFCTQASSYKWWRRLHSGGTSYIMNDTDSRQQWTPLTSNKNEQHCDSWQQWTTLRLLATMNNIATPSNNEQHCDPSQSSTTLTPGNNEPLRILAIINDTDFWQQWTTLRLLATINDTPGNTVTLNIVQPFDSWHSMNSE